MKGCISLYMSPTCHRADITIYSPLMLSLNLRFNKEALKEPLFT